MVCFSLKSNYMANNRMFLVCNVCHPEVPAKFAISNNIDGAIHIAKWYPAGGDFGGDDGSYYSNDWENLGGRFFKFLQDHQHKEVASEHYTAGAGQENPVRIEYESEGLPIKQQKPPITATPV